MYLDFHQNGVSLWLGEIVSNKHMIFEFFQEMLKKFILRVHVNELGLVLF